MVFIEYKKKNSINHSIREITTIYRQNPELVKYLKSFAIYEHIRGKQDLLPIIENACNTLNSPTGIDDSVIKKFSKLWCKLKAEEVGLFWEEVITINGPCSCLKKEDTDFSRESKVMDMDSNKNFDVIFFDKKFSQDKKENDEIHISGKTEFHECKRNIATYIPADKERPAKEKVEEKLIYMQNVYKLDKENFQVSFISFQNNVKPQEEYLKDHGYDCIKVIGIDKALSRH